MKKFTNAEIAQIRSNLNNGFVYCGIRNGNGVGIIAASPDGKYIRWRYYGESANENTNRDLRWLLETIFNICELSGFHIEGRIVIKDKRTGRVWK